MLFNVVSLGAVWTLFWYGSRQSAIPPVDIEPKKKSFKEVEELPVTTDDKQAKLKIQLLEYFNHKKPYLNPELSLKEVAQALQTNHYALSRFINKEFEVNFYTLINRFRVEYIFHKFIYLLLLQQYNHLQREVEEYHFSIYILFYM